MKERASAEAGLRVGLLNTLYRKTFATLAVACACVCVCLFCLFYAEAKNSAIARLNEQQIMHAEQAARGIADFFAAWTRSLVAFSKMDPIINDDDGKRLMRLFYEAHQDEIGAITRLDERGVISYNCPLDGAVGADLSGQKHVAEMLRTQKPVISDVFTAVEGGAAIALHVPVFRGPEFKGSIGILVNFEGLTKRYLDVIKIGETGYAWVLSRDGTQLYSQIPGFTGKPIFENIKGEDPALLAMVNDMLEGHTGRATYTFGRIRDRNVGRTPKYAVFLPVHVGDTFWSIAVGSAEEDVLSGLIAFRNKLAFFIGALLLVGMAFSTLGAKAWLVVKEEDKRKLAEAEALRLSAELAHVVRVSTMDHLASSLAHELSQPLGAILRNAEAAELFLQDPSPDLEEVRAILADIRSDDRRAGEVIDRMRGFMKRRDIERHHLDLDELTGEVVQLVRPDTERHHVRLTLERASALPPVQGDKVQLQQVLLNLLINATESLEDKPPEQRCITVRSRLAGARIEVAVSDNGSGIPADMFARLFEPFFTSKPGGLGMGLAISRSIIKAHGGELRAENNAEGGATFTFSLPVVSEEKSVARHDTAEGHDYGV